MANTYQQIAQAVLQGQRVVRMTALDGTHFGQVTWGHTVPSAFMNCKPPCVCHTDAGTILFEVLCHQKTLLICGGGHISVPVCTLAKMLGYRVIVVDDRQEFACQQRFPQADQVICADFEEYLRAFDWKATPDLSVVIVTRGHVADTVCLRQTVGWGCMYLGMIGSKRKNQAVFDVLRAEGISEQQLAQVHAPIGLKIGAETPEEIAIAIAAEWISTRQQHSNTQLPEQMLQGLAQGQTGVMATVVNKQGSAPRGVGTRMFFCDDGRVMGTVGGGLTELEVTQKAAYIRQTKTPVQMTFDLSQGEAGKSGMICGGQIEVLFEVVE